MTKLIASCIIANKECYMLQDIIDVVYDSGMKTVKFTFSKLPVAETFVNGTQAIIIVDKINQNSSNPTVILSGTVEHCM